jgi:hypothetical protein
MNKIHSLKRSVFLGCLGLLVHSACAQIQAPHDGDITILVTPAIAPAAGLTASIDVYSNCSAPLGPSLLKPDTKHSVSTAKAIELSLANKLSVGEAVCVIQSYKAILGVAPAPAVPANVIFPVVYVAAVVAAAPTTLTIPPTYTGQSTIYIKPIPLSAGYTATIDIYTTCPQPPAAPTGTPLQKSSLANDVDPAGLTMALDLVNSVKIGDKFCAIETYTYIGVGGPPAKLPDISSVVTAADPVLSSNPFLKRAPIFVAVAGLDISGASSTNSQPVFHASAIFDVPINSKDDWINNTKWWLGGQLRIAGMAQPTALTGNLGDVTSVNSYLATAVNATPDKIVQSIEASFDAAFQLHKWQNSIDSLDVGTAARGVNKEDKSIGTIITISAIGSAGAITPLSASQANPPVYTVNDSIYKQYGPSGSSDLPTSCDPTVTTPTTCYVAFIPMDRSRFYRHYEGGARLKMYGRDFDDNEFRPAAIADLTLGKNEYVTGGKFASPVLHFGGWVPIPKLDAVYIFGSMDLALEQNTSGAQLILVPATTAGLTYSSSSVHQISVSQPDRDRYMFGFGVDLYHLLGKISFNKPLPQ